MPWTTPRTWVTDELVTAAMLNEQIRDNLNVLVTLVPTGTTVSYAGGSAPSGWLLCNGAAVSRTTYATLFATIGTTFGAGDGSTTFNLPDLRGRFPLGKDNMGGTSADRVTATQADNLGQGTGAETHTLSVAEMPSHAHSTPIYNASHGYDKWNLNTATIQSPNTNSWVATNASGGGVAHNNMPPYLTLNYIIKT